MLVLHEIQATFRRAILEEHAGAFCALIAAGGLAPEERLGIYRNNAFASLTAVLRETFPAVCRLVDERFFEPRLTLQLHPSFGFVASRWPIDRIWRANRPEAASEAAIDLAAGGVWLEVGRADADIIMRALDPATFAFRSAVQRGETLECATEVALFADPAFDLCRALPALFLDGAIIAVSFAQPHAGREPRQ